MIKIPYDELGKQNFQMAVQKLANSQLRDPVVFRIKHVTKSVREGFLKMRDEYKKLEEKYAEKNEGKIVEPKEGSEARKCELPWHTPDEKAKQAKDDLDNFGKKLLTVNHKKIPFETLFKCNEWSPRELESLEPIVEEPGDSV